MTIWTTLETIGSCILAAGLVTVGLFAVMAWYADSKSRSRGGKNDG